MIKIAVFTLNRGSTVKTRFLFVPIILCFVKSAGAQGTASITEVIEAFKAEIREVQTRDSGDCVLRISKVEFRFDAGQRLGFDENAGGEVEMFGVKLGAGGTMSTSQADTSTIRVTLLPDPGAADGAHNVSGDGRTSFKMHKPDLVDFHIVHNETMGADLIVLKFKKQLTTMSAPARFEFEIECSLSEKSTFKLTEVNKVSEEDMRQASCLTSAFHVPGTRLTEQALFEDGTMAASIPRPVQELQDACVEYFTELARLSGQQVELTVDDFKSRIIRPTAIFPQADVDDHPLAEIVIPLAGTR